MLAHTTVVRSEVWIGARIVKKESRNLDVRMSEAQKQVIARYYSFLHSVAVVESLKNARHMRIVEVLMDGQKNASQLASECGLDAVSIESIARVLVAIGFLEQYGEDYALSQAARLMVGFDANFGEEIFSALPEYLRNSQSTGNHHDYRQCIAGRQWTHTAAAMQAAEVLQIGESRKELKVLELGSSSGVWTAAMAYRDPTMHVTAVDTAGYANQIKTTFESVELLDRLTVVEADYRSWDVPLGAFDMVILPEVLQLESDADGVTLLGRAADALRPGGEVVIFERLNETDGPALAIAATSLEVANRDANRQATLRYRN